MQRILTQVIGVSQRRDRVGNEALIYAPSPLVDDDGPPPEESYQRVNSEVLGRLIDETRQRVEELTVLARTGKPRGDIGIERESASLSEHVLPKDGFFRVVRPEVHPHFDIVKDAAQDVPWEVLQEYYATCTCGAPDALIGHLEVPKKPVYCSNCGEQLSMDGGRLAIQRHLCHLVRGGSAPASEGDEFLVVVDPSDDLVTDKNDPDRICRDHIKQIIELLRQLGYTVSVLSKRNVTVKRFREAICRTSAVGMYYFGHGMFRREESEGKLILADGSFLASQIEQLNPQLRFVFLNACEGAATSGVWTLERRALSVGQAFSRGGPAKSTIATLWPVVNTQAAQFAREFFQALTDAGTPLGEALRAARCASLARYDDGAADISWMAYRYFGDPNRTLPEPVQARAHQASQLNVETDSRLFAAGRFDTDRFAFDVRDVLLRAAKRRNAQSRQRLSTADFLAGLVRTGQLTRHTLRAMNADADQLYTTIVGTVEEESAEASREDDSSSTSDEPGTEDTEPIAKLRAILEKWIVRDRRHFSDKLAELLRRAEDTAIRAGRGAAISERDVLRQLTLGGRWRVAADIKLPDASQFTEALDSVLQSGEIDENGCLTFPDLSSQVWRIIDEARDLAQQRGIREIPNRLLLAAILGNSDGYAANACSVLGCDAQLLCETLIATTEGKSPVTFDVNHETAGRVLLPVIQRARRMTTAGSPVDEATFFRAYCQRMPAGFKQAIKGLASPFGVDLDAAAAAEESAHTLSARSPRAVETLNSSSPSALGRPLLAEPSTEQGGRRLPAVKEFPNQEEIANLLSAAADAAAAQGGNEITSIHLLVGLLIGGQGLIANALRRAGQRPECVAIRLLGWVKPSKSRGASSQSFMISKNVRQTLHRSVSRMRDAKRSKVSEVDLCHAVVAEPVKSVRSALHDLGLDWLTHQQFAENDESA